MATLSNARHERFAQEVANGQSGTQAYLTAGYPTNAKAAGVSASRLLENPKVKDRIAEILTERESIRQREVTEAVKAASLSKQWVLERLMENADRALQRQPVLDDEGAPIGEYTYNGSVANRALELLGKEVGMFIDRKDVSIDDKRQPRELSSADLDERIDAALQRIEALTIGANGKDTGTHGPSDIRKFN